MSYLWAWEANLYITLMFWEYIYNCKIFLILRYAIRSWYLNHAQGNFLHLYYLLVPALGKNLAKFWQKKGWHWFPTWGLVPTLPSTSPPSVQNSPSVCLRCKVGEAIEEKTLKWKNGKAIFQTNTWHLCTIQQVNWGPHKSICNWEACTTWWPTLSTLGSWCNAQFTTCWRNIVEGWDRHSTLLSWKYQ